VRKYWLSGADVSSVKKTSALLVVLALGLTACQAADAATVDSHNKSEGTEITSQAALSITPASRKGVNPNKRIVVRASGGTIHDVRVVDADSHKVKGKIRADGTWQSANKPLAYGTTYRVTAQAIDADGRGKVVSSTFRTVKPKHKLTTSISPVSGATVGVGMPVIVHLSSDVTNRAAVQKSLTVETSRPVVGSWSWLSDHEVHWRPKSYWPADTKVSVNVNLTGVKAGNGVWGAEKRQVNFTIGSATISTVDDSTHEMTVTNNGKVVRTIPITTGKDGFLTRSGIKLVVSKERYRVMDAATIDIPKTSSDYYRLKVEYAMRLTWSGEFLHAAPWSVGYQGREDVSHGCTGMSTANAAWLYNLTKIGDVVIYKGFNRPLESGNGWTDWNVSWTDWKANSAL
jgi:lipoprotein-anchoring transpeptidase ErfK/SrfK